MRKVSLIAAAAVALALTLSGCSSAAESMDDEPAASATQEAAETPEASMDDEMDEKDESMDEMTEMSGSFVGQGEKSVSGTVTVSGDKIMLTDFSSSEGPDLHIYLANGDDLDAVSAGMEVDLVASDEASQTFTLDGMHPADYSHVVIYCDKAKVVFGAAELM